MRREVKIYSVSGQIFLHRLSEWRKFTVEVLAIKPEHAVERVLSELGSRHKLKRKHIKIIKVEEVNAERVKNITIKDLTNLNRILAG
ncbi:MAG: 50S ribosomal protein L18Ae [Thermofilaceae archaeon]